jgi:hypothetical protein
MCGQLNCVMSVDDLTIAESTYLALLDAQHLPSAAAAELVRSLRMRTQNSGRQSHGIEMAQAEAWLSICALSKSLDRENEAAAEDWARAIARTEEWRNLLD